MEEVWEMVKFWAALQVSVYPDFRNISLSDIILIGKLINVLFASTSGGL